MRTQPTDKERIDALEEAMCIANSDIATHWHVRGQQMEEIVRLRELLDYVDTEVVESVIENGACCCNPEAGDNPCEYCAAVHFRSVKSQNARI